MGLGRRKDAGWQRNGPEQRRRREWLDVMYRGGRERRGIWGDVGIRRFILHYTSLAFSPLIIPGFPTAALPSSPQKETPPAVLGDIDEHS